MVRPTCMAVYAAATYNPRSPNASVSVADRTRLASMMATSGSRTARVSGLNQLVNQAV
jgi:hypothetical protein